MVSMKEGDVEQSRCHALLDMQLEKEIVYCSLMFYDWDFGDCFLHSMT